MRTSTPATSAWMPCRPFPPDLFAASGVSAKAKESLTALLDFKIRPRHTLFNDWTVLYSLGPLLAMLSEERSAFYMEKITESVSNGLTRSSTLLKNVFQSKVYYIVHSHVKNWFGQEYQAVSDVTITRKENALTTVVLSSEPIVDHPSHEIDHGMHYALIEDASQKVTPEQAAQNAQLFDDTIQWTLVGGNNYRAHIQISVKENSPASLVTANPGPDYEGVWQDQKMVGAIVIGSSLRGFSRTLLEHYLSYFRSEGFEFAPLAVENFKTFFLQQVADCQIDYFLKESHSDGDERNILRVDLHNNIAKGIRQGEDGRQEIIYLVFPKAYSLRARETALISHRELGQAMRERVRKSCGEVTYFNTGCWAHVKARYEIESVHSPLFINIPSSTMAETFLNREGDSIRELIHSYRNGLDFKGFRNSLKKNRGYVSRQLNRYLFPDEKAYETSILQHIPIPLTLDIQLERKRGGQWQPIDPDEAL